MKRLIPTFAVAALGGGCALLEESVPATDVVNLDEIPVIDTHIHLYDPTREQRVPWPPEDDPVLYRPVLADDFREVAEENGLAGAVIVEASDWYADNRWVLDLTKDAPQTFVGLVGSLEIGVDSFEEHLSALSSDPRFVGIRMRSRPNGEDFFTPEVWTDLQTLSEAGKTLDILMFEFSLEDVAEIARRNPNLPILINHVAGADIDGNRPSDDWAQGVKLAAEYPNVFVKLSGLFQQSGERPSPKNLKFYQRHLDVLWNAFGPDRIVYGSNWPVLDHGGTYAEYKSIVFQYLASKGLRAASKVLFENAVTFYGLPAGLVTQ